MLTNDIVSFEQPGPGLGTLYRSEFLAHSADPDQMLQNAMSELTRANSGTPYIGNGSVQIVR